MPSLIQFTGQLEEGQVVEDAELVHLLPQSAQSVPLAQILPPSSHSLHPGHVLRHASAGKGGLTAANTWAKAGTGACY